MKYDERSNVIFSLSGKIMWILFKYYTKYIFLNFIIMILKYFESNWIWIKKCMNAVSRIYFYFSGIFSCSTQKCVSEKNANVVKCALLVF